MGFQKHYLFLKYMNFLYSFCYHQDLQTESSGQTMIHHSNILQVLFFSWFGPINTACH